LNRCHVAEKEFLSLPWWQVVLGRHTSGVVAARKGHVAEM
jgi:hypothetical protein